MPELYVAKVDYEEAKKLADFASIYQDLSFTVDVLKRLIQLVEEDNEDSILTQSLWTAALISYVRCFSSGKRFGSGLQENIFEDLEYDPELEDDPITCHRYYKNLRDKHIAHSVNPFEQVEVGLILSEPDNPDREIQGVATLLQKLIHLDVEGLKSLLRLVLFAKEEVRKQAKECETRTLEVGKGLPIDALYSKARVRIITPAPVDAGRARK